jgi:hypothetical protein
MNAPKLFTSTHNPCLLPPGSQEPTADAPANASAVLSFPSAGVSPTAAAAVMVGAPPCSSAVTANNSSSCGSGKVVPQVLSRDSNLPTSQATLLQARGARSSAGVTSGPHDFIASIFRMKSLPYSAVNNRNRFILDVEAFERALGGEA